MKIRATVQNRDGEHSAVVHTNEQSRALAIPPKPAGGSAVNGGELLFLALATCYCNDLYREAGKRGIRLTSVSVEVEGEFGGVGEPARGIRYRTELAGDASDAQLSALAADTDAVAEIQATLRAGATVELTGVTITRPGR